MNDKTMLYGGGILAAALVLYLLSKGSGPSFATVGGPSSTAYKDLAASNAQLIAADSADTQGKLDALTKIYGVKTAYQTSNLTIQTNAQSERLRLDNALQIARVAQDTTKYQTDAAERVSAGQTAAQVQANNNQTATQQQGGFFDFLGGLAKIVLPFLF